MFIRITSGLAGAKNVVTRRPGALSTSLSTFPWPKSSGQTVPQRASSTRHQLFATTSHSSRDSHQKLSEDAVTFEPSSSAATESITPPAAASSPVNQPLTSLLPAHPSHNSLATFISFAQHSNLNTTRHTYLGTRYEYLAQATLLRLGFELLRIGKTGDKGVDLAGRWHLPAAQKHENVTSEHLKVVVQCKRITGKRKLSPSVVREMDGAFLGAPAGWRGEAVFGIIVSTKPATRGVIAALQASRRALVWVCMEEHDVGQGHNMADEGGDAVPVADPETVTDREEVDRATDSDEVDTVDEEYSYDLVYGRVVQLLYNGAAQRLGLEGLDVIKRHDAHDEQTTVLGDGVMLVYRGNLVQEPLV